MAIARRNRCHDSRINASLGHATRPRPTSPCPTACSSQESLGKLMVRLRVIRNAVPRTTDIIPSVTMKGGSFARQITAPETAPQSAPQPIAMGTASAMGSGSGAS